MIPKGQSMENWFVDFTCKPYVEHPYVFNLERDWSGAKARIWTKQNWLMGDLRFLEYKKSLQAFGEVLKTHLFTLP